MTLTPGETIGRYQVLAQIGAGGMASVYKAYQLGLERVVALKVLRLGATEDAEFRELVRRLRATEEWRYIEREVDIRLAR